MTATDGLYSATTLDGTWVAVTSNTFEDNIYFTNVASGNGTFVVFAGSNIYSSPDGLTWTKNTLPDVTFFAHYRNLSFSASTGVFVVVGSTNKAVVIYWSKDGITWQAATAPPISLGPTSSIASSTQTE